MSDMSSIELMPFVWGIAFTLNIAIGLLIFGGVINKKFPEWGTAMFAWIGWWTCASALTLLINALAGPENPFSYHQIGIVTESMVNLGIMVVLGVHLVRKYDDTE